MFLRPEASQENLKRPKKAPRRHPKSSKTPKKGIQNWTQKINNFWTTFGAILGSKMGFQKGTKNGNTFGSPFPRISGVQITPCQKLNERGEKPTGAGIILSKRKGGIRPWKAL